MPSDTAWTVARPSAWSTKGYRTRPAPSAAHRSAPVMASQEAPDEVREGRQRAPGGEREADHQRERPVLPQPVPAREHEQHRRRVARDHRAHELRGLLVVAAAGGEDDPG